MRLSILWKLLVPIVLVVSVLASGLLWVHLHLLDQSYRRRALEHVIEATQAIQNEQRDLEDKTRLVAENLARDPFIVRALLVHNQNDADVVLATAASATGVPTIAVFDSRGDLFAATWPAHASTIPPQTVSLVSRALAGTVVTGPIQSWRLPGQVAIAAMAPIRDLAQVHGVVVVEDVMGNAFVDEVKYLTRLEVGVFLGDRRVASTSFSKDGRRIVNERTPSRNAHKTLTEGQTTTDEVTAGGRRFISSYLPLRSPAGPIIGMIGVGAPLDRINQDRRDTIRSSILASLLGLGFACALMVVIGYRILTPLRRLKNSADAIRRGTPEQADFAITTHDEIQDLSGAMSEMVHDLAEVNAALREASRHKSEFLARMSHELRTPLNAVIGFSELLLERIAGDLTAKQEEYLRDIHTSGAHLLTLINEILDLSKIEAGRMELTFGETNLTEVVESALTTLRPLIEQKRLDVSAALDPAAITVRADKVRLKQILFNLLSNAAKFTPPEGKIRVEARRIGDDLELTVVDTGPGIAPEDQGKLFREFTQLDATHEMNQAGTGLGLVLVKRLVELHGGRVRVESAVGQGSRFILRIPMGTRTAPVTNGAGPVLVAEDDPALRKLFTHFLSEAGYRTDEISDGAGMVDKVKAIRPSVICLDIRMPGVEDWEIMRRLKEDPATASIPIVVTTVLDDAETAFALGALAFLVKPVGRKDLLDAVANAMRTPAGVMPTVLLVDDDRQVLDIMAPMLEQGGYRVLRASGGQEGIQQAREHLPHLIVLDLMMPGVNGFDVVATLRDDVRTRGIPIIVLTAKDLTPEDRAYLNGRVQGIQLKGATPARALVEAVKRVLTSGEVGGR
jgi:signal transduction histidine kinase/CheY-like chemotaxis protein